MNVMNVPCPSSVTPRLGLMKVRVAARFLVRRPKAAPAVHEVRDARRHAKAVAKCHCLTCGKDYESEDQMVTAHPSQDVMERQREAHVWGFWSDDKLPDGGVLGLLSDEA